MIVKTLRTNPAISGPKIASFEIPRSEIVVAKDPISGGVYPLFVKLPRSYTRNPEKHYPVIYLTDAWSSFQIVSGATRVPMNSGKMEEAIIVAISYEQTVKPYIKNHYRASQINSTFVGNSLGGLLAAYIILSKPDLFDNYILGSPSVWFANKAILGLKAQPSKNDHKIFIGIGALEQPLIGSAIVDMVEDAKSLQEKFVLASTENNHVKLIVIPEANHDIAFPTTAIHGLQWLY